MGRIFVAGVTGRVGRQVVSRLSAADSSIRVLVRRREPADLPELEVLGEGLRIPTTLEACRDGLDLVFLVWCASADSVLVTSKITEVTGMPLRRFGDRAANAAEFQ